MNILKLNFFKIIAIRLHLTATGAEEGVLRLHTSMISPANLSIFGRATQGARKECLRHLSCILGWCFRLGSQIHFTQRRKGAKECKESLRATREER